MSTPTVLPWHREAAVAVLSESLPSMSQFAHYEDCEVARIKATAARIARHDPHAAQHAETLRLLEEAREYVQHHAEQTGGSYACKFNEQIRRHLVRDCR